MLTVHEIDVVMTQWIGPFKEFAPENVVRVVDCKHDIAIGWHHCEKGTATEHKSDDASFVDCWIERRRFYILSIWLAAKYRGQGIGSNLYDALVNAAAEIGCTRIEQTPFGSTVRGQTRLEYLMKRGWLINHANTCPLPAVYKDLTHARIDTPQNCRTE